MASKRPRRRSKPYTEYLHVDHVDYDWITKKIDGHGGAYSYDSPDGKVTICSIFGKNRIQIFWYNLILYWKYLKRKVYEMKRRRLKNK